MAEIAAFQKKLEDIETLAKLNGRRLAREGVAHFFSGDGLNEEQLDQICEYLRVRGIRILGEKKEEISPGEPQKLERIPLSPEEEDYLRSYQAALPPEGEGAFLEACMRKAVPLAVEYHVAGSFIGDILQEGSISLVAELAGGELSEQEAMEAVRRGMEQAARSLTRQRYEDNFLVEKVRRLEEAIREFDEEVGTKSTIEELSAYLDMEAEEIRAILSMTGEE